MESHVARKEPVLPLILAGTPLEGNDGWFILRQGKKSLFECPLANAFEIAMTAEDGPYDFVLMLEGIEDAVSIDDVASLELPVTLEALGLKGDA